MRARSSNVIGWRNDGGLVDVFFCTAAITPERMGLARLCQLEWEKMDAPIALHVITPQLLGVSRDEFQRARRMYADAESKHYFYFVVDDDCFPKGRCVGQLLAALAAHREFAILSALPKNCNIVPWTPEDFTAFEDPDVMEHVSVGGIRCCRQKAMATWPEMEMDGPGYDRIHADTLRQLKWRVGYAKKALMYHAGEGRSTVWPRLTGSKGT